MSARPLQSLPLQALRADRLPLLPALGGSMVLLACDSITSSASSFTWPFLLYFCLWLFMCLSLRSTFALELGAHPDCAGWPHLEIFNLTMSTKILTWNKFLFTASRDSDMDLSDREATIQPTTVGTLRSTSFVLGSLHLDKVESSQEVTLGFSSKLTTE